VIKFHMGYVDSLSNLAISVSIMFQLIEYVAFLHKSSLERRIYHSFCPIFAFSTKP
jgi:hypothetical protein